MKLITLFILFIASGCCATGMDQELLDSAAVYYEDGRYDKAILLWQQAALQKTSAPVFYNLGLAYKNSGKPLEAIYSFEQALRLRPWSNDIRAQLDFIRSGIKDPVIAAKPFFLLTWVHYLMALFRPGIWSLLGLLFIMVVIVNFVATQKRRPPNPFLFGNMPLYLLAAGLLLLVFAMLSFARLSDKDEAMTTSYCEIRQGPAKESPVVRAIAAGEKLILLDEIGSWRYVRLANLDKGWVPSACIKTIQLPGY